MKTVDLMKTWMSRMLAFLLFVLTLTIHSASNAQCNSPNQIYDPEDFQWTYHPVSATNPEAYYSGTMEVGDTTFTFNNGETLTTRAYRQKGHAYSIPGPTLRMTPGNKYVLSLHNLLPYEAKSMSMNVFKDPNVVNLHTHGLHISGESPGDDVHRSFEGGRGGDFVYDIPADHMGGTYWYHAHHHGSTTLQVSGGMLGMIIIDDANDNIPSPVAAMEEKLLQMAMIDPTVAGLGGDQLISGTMSGMRWTVNGIIGGEICMPPNTWQHWRVSVADPMAMLRDLTFGPECEVMVLARDGVWRTVAPKDLPSNSLQLTGASRADFAIRTSSNSTIKMGNMTIATISVDGISNPFPHPYDNDGVSQWSASRPSYLRDLRNESNVHSESISMGARTVNGSKFDHMQPNITLPATDVQEWSLSGNVRHPFHLHIYHVQALVDDRDFEAGEYYDVVASQMDIRFDLNSSTTSAYSGRTIMHCHILEHEDQGAMGWLNVLGGEGPPTFPLDTDSTVSFGEYYILGGNGSQNQPPQSVISLQATASSSSTIDLTWIDNSTYEEGFNIERSSDGVNFTLISTTVANVENYTDNNLSPSSTYYYRIVAFNSFGSASPSNIADATTLGLGGNGTVIVENIDVVREALNGGRYRGVATITIIDQNQNPVSGANVNGIFSGPNSTSASGTTDQNGQISLTSQSIKNPNGDWCYEVLNVQITGSNYDPASNIMSIGCEGGTAAKSMNSSEISIFSDLKIIDLFPNPTDEYTNILFELSNESNVQILVFDMLGNEVANIVDQNFKSGRHKVRWFCEELNSGSYIIQINSDAKMDKKRLVLFR